MARSPYQSRSMTAGLLESAPMHRRRHRTRITFPSTTPVAWDQKLRLPRQEVPMLPARQGAEVPPGQRGEHMRPIHRPSWAVGETQGRARAKHSPGEPPACETQQQDPARSGAGWQRRIHRCPALTCPYEIDAMAPAVYRPTPGNSFCRSSAVLGIWPASSDTTWERGG